MKNTCTILVAQLFALTLFSSLTSAQGTATSPSTFHYIEPSTNIAWIGGPNDTVNGPGPIPIDLDASGGPWRKALVSDPVAGYGGGNLYIRESIINVGTEPWTDWHETMLNNGSHSSTWGGVTDIRIDGTSITFTASVTGGGTQLDLDSFSQPVLPGQVLEIDKEFGLMPDLFVGPGTTVNNLLQYPTTIPEPSSLAILCCSTVVGLSRRRRK